MYVLGLSREGFHRIFYTEWGTPSNHNPLICLHGATRHSRDFDLLANYLSRGSHRHIFCPDLVGRGESDWLKNPANYSYEQYLADMNVLISRTGQQAVDWLGTSLGGIIGMVLAAQVQSPIKRLILNDIGPQIPANAMRRLANYVGLEPSFNDLEEAILYYKKIFTHIGQLDEATWNRLVSHTIKKTSGGKYMAKMDQRIKMPFSKKAMLWNLLRHPTQLLSENPFDLYLWEMWRKVNCPVLVIYGEKSDVLTPFIMEKMKHLKPETTFFEVKKTGHAPLLESDIEMEMIAKWLQMSL